MKIVFRKFKDDQVIALFCGTGKDCNPGNVMSYMRIGQHGEASRYIGRYLPLANESEYLPLKREIESIYGVEIKPVKRLTT